jgi:hypothetical protein
MIEIRKAMQIQWQAASFRPSQKLAPVFRLKRLDRHHQLAIGWTNHLGTIIWLAISHSIYPCGAKRECSCSLRSCSLPMIYELLSDVTFWMSKAVKWTSGVCPVEHGNFLTYTYPFKNFLHVTFSRFVFTNIQELQNTVLPPSQHISTRMVQILYQNIRATPRVSLKITN